MLADPSLVVRALGLPGETRVEWEPLGPGKERWRLCPLQGAARVVIVRRDPAFERAANNAAVTEALVRAGFGSMPPVVAFLGETMLEEEVPGVSPLALAPPSGGCEAAIDGLAALHVLAVREGSRWDLGLEEIIPGEDPQLYRLGFAAHEREAAFPAFREARAALLAAPWGFVHGASTAANLLLAEGRAWFTGFEEAGFGCQLFDVAAFLLTAGLEASRRRGLAIRYARRLALEPEATAGLIDLAGISWGVRELLTVPRRSIELLGDDPGLAALNTAAIRIERGIREPAGGHPAAAAIRAALWPS